MVAVALAGLGAAGCKTAQMAIGESMGYAKREQLVDRVQEAQKSQEQAKEQFVDALEQFKALTGARGSSQLESVYDKIKREHDRSKARAKDVTDRIATVEFVSDALFKEWRAELGQYQNPELRAASERQLAQTQARYGELLGVMKRAEAKMDPVLRTLGDQVLFLKHNLNAQTIAALQGTVQTLESDVATLIRDMEASIGEADAFIQTLRTGS